MKQFKKSAQIPIGCLVAPSAYFVPRPGTKPIGSLNGSLFYDRADVSELLPAEEWKWRGRKIKPREKPIAHRGADDPVAVYADWQTE